MIAAVTDLDGRITGAHRTWLAPDGSGKAPVDPPRKAMGDLLGHAVRFGDARDVMAAGEGIETILSLHQALPTMPMVSALSAGHLAAILFPPQLRRLYIVRDNDPAGDNARGSLVDRAHEVGIETITLSPMMGSKMLRAGDTETEQRFVLDGLKSHGVEAGLADVYGQGGAGATALAEVIVARAKAATPSPRFVYDLEDPPEEKIRKIARAIYGASDVDFRDLSVREIQPPPGS